MAGGDRVRAASGGPSAMGRGGRGCLAGACGLVMLALGLPASAHAGDIRPFVITVVDADTGRGVPLVELETTNAIRLVTDSQGVAAFAEPGLMDQTVFFHVRSHGYEFARDGFGYRGKALEVKQGGEASLKIKRLNVAERLYRVTGGGIYRDSVLAGRPVPLRHPVLNAQVFGSDSVVSALYKGKLHWFWGDTAKPGYPLGNFHVPGATSNLPGDGGLDPDRGVDLEYYVGPSGFAKETAHLPGEGPTWVGGLVVLRESSGTERMFAGYVKVRPPMSVYERGLAEWDDARHEFRKVAAFPEKAPIHPTGHTLMLTEPGGTYVHYATPYPLQRVRAEADALRQADRYEAFTPLKAGSTLEKPVLDRDAGGRLHYGWKASTPAVGPAEQAKLLESGALKPGEGLLALRDVQTGQPVLAHGGSVCWNEHRRRWVMIAVQSFGTSFLGEVWFAEADTPLGPWVYARKVVTHDNYSFYNPKQHPYFDQDGGRLIYFEGTYTHTFSSNPVPTPRYDYNQVMYRLNLADPRLNLPVAVYEQGEPAAASKLATVRGLPAAGIAAGDEAGLMPPLAFFALERPGEGTVPVYEQPGAAGGRALAAAPQNPPPGASPLFHALPAAAAKPPASAVPLYEFVHQARGLRRYTTDRGWTAPGFERTAEPVCLVWRNPIALRLPRGGTLVNDQHEGKSSRQ